MCTRLGEFIILYTRYYYYCPTPIHRTSQRAVVVFPADVRGIYDIVAFAPSFSYRRFYIYIYIYIVRNALNNRAGERFQSAI